MGIGMGCVFGALFAAVLNGVDPKHAGSASGTLNAVQQVGGVIGVAVIGVIFFGQLTSKATASFNSIKPSLKSSLTSQHIPAQTQNTIISSAKTCFVEISQEKDSSIIPSICKNSNNNPSLLSIEESVNKSINNANSHNFTNAFRWSVIYTLGVLVLACLITFLLPSKFKTESYSEV
jgi:hypothetical protein